MAEKAVFCTKAEKKIVDDFLLELGGARKGRRCRNASKEEIDRLINEMKEARADGYERSRISCQNILSRHRRALKKAQASLVAAEEEPSIGTPAKDVSAARMILDEIKPVIMFMKPPDYLAPLEELLAENVKLKKENAALKAKGSSDNIVQLKKDLKQLQGFLAPAKTLLQLTCGLRQQAMGLTKKAEELKKKNGTDLNAFLLELEESEALK